MKLLQEIYHPNQEILDEKIGRALATGALAAAIAMPSAAVPTRLDQPEVKQELPRDEISTIAKRMRLAWPEIEEPTQRAKIASNLAKTYRVDKEMVEKIVDHAHDHQSKDFPKAEHILAIVGIESSFNPDSKSSLRYDPAVGLMQVRPHIWNLHPEDLSTIESQIKVGAAILRKYYKKTGSAEDAVQAYNLGITSFRRGRRNESYLAKYQRFLDKHFKNI